MWQWAIQSPGFDGSSTMSIVEPPGTSTVSFHARSSTGLAGLLVASGSKIDGADSPGQLWTQELKDGPDPGFVHLLSASPLRPIPPVAHDVLSRPGLGEGCLGSFEQGVSEIVIEARLHDQKVRLFLRLQKSVCGVFGHRYLRKAGRLG